MQLMELLAPSNLPGVGMGSALSIIGLGGLLGLAVTSGAMLAEGLVGIVVWVAASIAALEAKPDHLGGRPSLVIGMLAAMLALGLVRIFVERRAGDPFCTTARWLAIATVLAGSAMAGVAWSEWNEVPISIGDAESIVGLAAGIMAGAVGGHAAWLFTSGSVRGGASRAIVVGTVLIVALVLNAASVYVPFAGFVILVAAALLAWRLHRRDRGKYKGLRILA